MDNPGSDTKAFIFYTTQDGGESWTAGSELIPASEKGFYWYSFYNIEQGFVTDSNALYSTQNGGRSWKKVNNDMNVSGISHMFFSLISAVG